MNEKIKKVLHSKTVETIEKMDLNKTFSKDNLNSLKDAWTECKSMNQQLEMLRVKSDTQIKLYTEKIKSLNKIVYKAFSEREPALKALYRNLERAEKNGDRELIVSCLVSITGIVIKNPLEEVSRLAKSFEFGNQDILEIDF